MKRLKSHIHTLLTKGSEKIGTDLVYIVKGGTWLALGQGVASLGGICLAIAFANLLSIETYGNLKFILSFLSLLSIPTIQGMNLAIVRTVAQGNEATIYPALSLRMKGGFIGSLASLGVALYFTTTNASSLVFGFLILACAVPFFQTLPLWKDYLNGKKKFRTLSIYQSTGNILRITVIIITLFITQNIFFILGAYLLTHILTHAATFLITLKRYPPNTRKDVTTTPYAFHLSAMSVLDTIANQVDKILLFFFLGPASIAIYAFALRPVEELRNLLQSISKLNIPKLSMRDLPTLRHTLSKKVLLFSLAIIPFVALYIILAPLFFSLVFPQYESAVIYSQVFSLTLILYPKKIMWHVLTAHAQKKELYVLNTLIPLIKIALFFTLLPLYSIWGVIATLFIIEVITYVALWITLFQIGKSDAQHARTPPTASS
ncbi:MAG: oligosaccharide flippase family protein [Parcubacteria group bacterium]|nr:oligosaccharide flippase family protein [Parcubacteria group bacterium]